SCSVGASKPNPLIYREALRAVKVQADQALYIDDIAAYVDAARRLGMGGIQFRSPDQLRSELRGMGVDLC
ncbi:MAG: HAD-IA family hydrolase, partial [Blastocatellia bacterium]